MSGTVPIALALLLPIAVALIVPLLATRPNLREAVTLIGAVALFASMLLLLPEILAGTRPALRLVAIVPGLSIAFAVEPLGMLFALVA
jgi:multicomponent Na+:H+ antiporter subunit D